MIATQIGSAVVRSKAQEALRQSQANLQTLFDSVGDFLFVLDMQGRILRANQDKLKTDEVDGGSMFWFTLPGE